MATAVNPLAIRVSANLDDFRKGMAEMKAQLETTKAAMTQMSAAFDGAGVMARANAAVKAVADLGGITRLTAAEQARYNAILQQGLELYTARGRTAPAALAAEAAAAKQVTATTAELSGTLGNVSGLLMNIAGSLGLAFSIGGLVSMVKSTLAWAEDLENTANALDMNVEQLQRLEFAWNTTGASADKGISAIQMMLQRIGAGQADAAIERLGYSLYMIEQMRPADMFLTLTGALSGITSETDRARIGAEVFGKGWKSIAISVANDMASVAAQAPYLAEAEVKELERANQAIERWSAKWKIATGEFLAWTQGAARTSQPGAPSLWGDWYRAAVDEMQAPKMTGDTATAVAASLSKYSVSGLLGTGQNRPQVAGQLLATVAMPAAGTSAEMEALTESTRRLSEVLPDVIRKQKEWGETEAAWKALSIELTAAQKAQIDSGLVLTDNLDLIATHFKLPAAAVKDYKTGLDDAKATQEWFSGEVLKNNRALADAITRQLDQQDEEAKRFAERQGEANDKLYLSAAQYHDQTAALTMSGTALALQQSGIQERAELARIAAVRNADDSAKASATAAAVQYFDTERLLIQQSHADWIEYLGQIESAFSGWSGTFEGIGRSVSTLFAGIRTGLQGAATISKDLIARDLARDRVDYAGAIGDLSGVNRALKEADAATLKLGVDLTVAAVNAVASFSKISSSAGALSNVMNGFAGGFGLGSSIGSFFGPVGKTLGGIIGGIGGALFGGIAGLFGPSEQEIRDQQANESLAQYRDQLLQTYGTLMNVDTIAQATGSDLAAAFIGAKGQTGLIWYNAALKDFEATQKTLLASLEQGTGLASEYARALMKAYEAADATDQQHQQAADYYKANLTTAATGLTALLAGLQTSADAVARQTFIDLQLAAGSTRAAAEAAAKDITGVFLTTEAQAEGLGSSIIATFGEMLDRGISFKDALAAVQGPVTTLQQELEATGFRGGQAFEYLTEMSTIANDAIMGPLAAAIAGSKDALVGLSNSGLLTQSMFTGIGESAAEAYQSIVRQGGDAAAAMGILAPTLQTIWQLQKFGKFTVDATTQALLDQAVAAHLVGEGAETDAQKQLAALNQIAGAMGELVDYFQNVFPSAVNAAFDSIGNGATGLQDRLDEYRHYVTPTPTHPPGGTPNFANGTDGYEWFGAGTPAMLHGWEAVVPLSRGASGAASPSSTPAPAAPPAPVTNIFRFEIKAYDRAGVKDTLVKEVLPAMAEILRRGGQPRTEILEGLGLRR